MPKCDCCNMRNVDCNPLFIGGESWRLCNHCIDAKIVDWSELS